MLKKILQKTNDNVKKKNSWKTWKPTTTTRIKCRSHLSVLPVYLLRVTSAHFNLFQFKHLSLSFAIAALLEIVQCFLCLLRWVTLPRVAQHVNSYVVQRPMDWLSIRPISLVAIYLSIVHICPRLIETLEKECFRKWPILALFIKNKKT